MFAKLLPTVPMCGIPSPPPPLLKPAPVIASNKLSLDNYSSQIVPPKKPERRFVSPTRVNREPSRTLLPATDTSSPPQVAMSSSQTGAVQSSLYGAQLSGSTFSLISTATLIPGREDYTQVETRHPLDDLNERSDDFPQNIPPKNLSGPHHSPDITAGNFTRSYALRTKSGSAPKSNRIPHKVMTDPGAKPAMERKALVDSKPLLDAIDELRELLLLRLAQVT